jgi:hypothetical protein
MQSRSFAAFIGRVIVYVFIIGVALAIAQALWNFFDLDRNDELAALRGEWTPLLAVAPVVCAIVGALLRPLGIFAVFYVAGAVLTAPFALLHAVAR